MTTRKTLEIIYNAHAQAGDTDKDFTDWAIEYLLSILNRATAASIKNNNERR
jgi:hypothetical protein